MIQSYRKKTDYLLAERHLFQRQVERELESLDEAIQSVESTAEAQRIIQGIAQALQQRAHDRIAGVVTRCLHAVFDDPYDFAIRFDQKRNKTEAKLGFVRDGHEYFDDPLNEVGGGVIDVAALALRLSVVLLSRPPLRRLLVLDEPFKSVRGRGNRQRVRSMIQRLADDLDVQFFINIDRDTYPEFCMGKVVELGGE